MKIDILSITKTNLGKKDLPPQFGELVRPDLIKRAVEAVQAKKRQSYGAKEGAGMRASAELSRRRRKYRGSYGHGISRVQRKIMTRRGTSMYWVGAVVPGTVGGRKAHPPKSEKILSKKINKKENRKAIRSAIAATMVKELVKNRGHAVPKDYPFAVEAKIEDLSQTKKVNESLEKLGLGEEMKRASQKKIRAGKGKSRGRRHRSKKGPLIVVSKECPLLNTARNIPGTEVVEVNSLNAEMLAPGTELGRLTLFTDAALEMLAQERLFMNDYKGKNTKKQVEKAQSEKEKKAAAKKEENKTKPKTKKKAVKKAKKTSKPEKA